MSKKFFLNLYNNNDSGLCNQIYSLIVTICNCINKNDNIIIINNFLKSIHTNNYCDVSDIFDLSHINEVLKEYNVILIDKKTVTINNETFVNCTDWNIMNIHPYNIICNKILKNIKFSKNINKIFYNEIIKNPDNYNSYINIIHLRIEPDALIHWSKMNNISYDNFKNIIIKKYISAINEHITPNLRKMGQ